MTRPSRLQAPKESGRCVAEPPLDQTATLVRQNQALLADWDYDFQGRSARELRAGAREALIASARKYSQQVNPGDAGPALFDASVTACLPVVDGPLILTGHQPELFHPGVWIKNFASHRLAQEFGGLSVHLIVDNDTVKKTTVRLPTGNVDSPSIVHIPFDRWRGEIPYEEYFVADEGLFNSFGDRVTAALEPLGIRPLLAEYWPMVLTLTPPLASLSERFSRARRWQESSWGCENLELPVSRLCQTEGFQWFVCHVLANIRRFRAVYNATLEQYRRRNRIRSRNHPVPSLQENGEWLEAPFWVWNTRSPWRRNLFVRQHGRELELSDREQWRMTLPLAPDREGCCAVAACAEAARQGIKIRTRALTTTIFSRLLLADLFIHGLGGARYDELADLIIQQFFRIEPPRFLTMTGTQCLPLVPRPASTIQAQDLKHRLRDLAFNPERYLATTVDDHGELRSLTERKQMLIKQELKGRSERRTRFQDIRLINEQLSSRLGEVRARTVAELQQVLHDLQVNTIIGARDWAFPVYPGEALRRFLTGNIR